MQSPHCLVLFAIGLAAAIPAQIATYVPYGNGCPGTGSGLSGGYVAPASYANAFAGSNNVMGLSGPTQRYQQVFTASQFPQPFTMAGVALRWDNQNVLAQYGGQVDLEIHVGYTTKTPTTLSTTFAANFDSGTPVTVMPRQFVTFPDQPAPPATDPTQFQVLIPWTTPFAWAPQPGQNLLIEFVQRGQFPAFTYVFDCGYSAETARLYGSDTATTGSTDGFSYGYLMKFMAQTFTAVPVLSNSDFPQLGGQFSVTLQHAKPQTIALLEHGVSASNVNLGAIGAPACSLLTSADILLVVNTNSQGNASFQYDIPMLLSLMGLHLYNQFAVFDPTANNFGFAFSNGGDGVIGS